MTPPANVKFQPPVPPRRVRIQEVAKATQRPAEKPSKPVEVLVAEVLDDEHEQNLGDFVAEGEGHYRVFGWISLDDLIIDYDIQRPLIVAEVNKIAADFNEAALGTLTISARVDPRTGETTYVVVDGQQRRAGAIKAGFTGKVRADVHHNLTRADEAALFRRLNFRRSVAPIVLFKTALVEGNPHALAVQKILDDLDIAFGTVRGFSGAKTALRLVARRNGETTLRWALGMVQRIYDGTGTGGCYDASVVEAFYWLYDRFGSRIDEDNLYKKLARMGGGVDDLIGQAHTIKSVRRGRLTVNLIRAIIARYNANKHANSRSALPDWTVDADTNVETEDVAEVGAE